MLFQNTYKFSSHKVFISETRVWFPLFLIQKFKMATDGDLQIAHRNFTFPASARTAIIACDGVAIRFMSFVLQCMQKLTFAAIAPFPTKTMFLWEPKLLSARTVTWQKYHCAGTGSLPTACRAVLQK